MKPDPKKKNFSLLWILGGAVAAAGAAIIFGRSKDTVSNDRYSKEEKRILEEAPDLILQLRSSLSSLPYERKQEAERLLIGYERRLTMLKEANRLFPNDVDVRRAIYQAELSLEELEQRLDPP